MTNYLTIDVGGTNIKYALMTEEAQILEQGEVPTPADSLDVFLDTLTQIYEKYADREIKALAMSAPGRIDSSTGYFFTSGALGYITGVNLPEKLKDRIPVPVSVENDAKAAALAELWKGSMQGIRNGTVIVLGTGIGGALIIEGKLYRGSTFAAGEYSVTAVRLDEPFRHDKIWARINGVPALVADYASRIGVDPAELNGRILFGKANEGDKDALDAIAHYCQHLSTAIISLQTILDVEKVAIGGGISKQPVLLETLNRVLTEMGGPYSGVMPFTLPEVTACTFGNDANMIGALYHYLYELN